MQVEGLRAAFVPPVQVVPTRPHQAGVQERSQVLPLPPAAHQGQFGAPEESAWQDEDGKVYTLKRETDSTWSCVRWESDRRGRPFSVSYCATGGVCWWGSSRRYYCCPLELTADNVAWYKAGTFSVRDPPAFIWRRLPWRQM